MRKKALTSLILVCVLLLGALPAFAQQQVFEAEAQGFGGAVQVRLTYEDGQLVSVEATGAQETQGIGSLAIESLPAAILQANSADIDGVAGATITSSALLSAAKEAMAAASGLAPQDQELAFTPGAYEGEALGYGGMLQVRVTLSEHAIDSVEILADKETEGVGKTAVELLPEAIVQAQSLAVDTIAGCTVSSNAILSAVKQAIESSGTDTAALNRPVPKEDNSANEPIVAQADVIIVGAGPAGMAASIAAADEGASVILLEKMSFVGGASAISGGSVNAGDSHYQAERGIEDSVELIYSDILRQGENQNDLRLARLYAENVGSTFDWLVDDLGVEFEDEAYYAAEHSVLRAFKSKSNPLCYSTIQTLKENVLERGVDLRMNMRADSLIVDQDGRITGVQAYDSTQQTYLFQGEAVVLASGGFGANRELLSDNLASCLYYGPVSSTGDGLRMALEVGAITQNMTMGKCVPDGFEYAPGLGKSTSNSNKEAFLKGSAILLNEDGQRFADETGEREVFAEEIRNSSTGQNYLFMDQETWDIFLTKNKTFSLEEAERWFQQNGTTTPMFIRADTIEEAAVAAGLDPDAVQQSVDRYNQLFEQGVDEDFGRELVKAIGEGPYYIIEQKLRFATTLGGLRTSTNMEVYAQNDQPIPGLYAGGEIVGGAQGANALVGGNNGWALTSGKIAGTQAALSLQQ